MGRVVITASMLEDLARSGAEISVPRDALITPAARDWLRAYNRPVTWTDAKGDGRASDGRLGVVIDLSRAMLRSLYSSLERTLGTPQAFEPSKKGEGELGATRQLCQALRAGTVARGVIFADDAAAVCCVASKHQGIRAAVGTSVAAVEQAARSLGINVLVIEAGQQTYHQIRQMIERFVNGRGHPDERVASAIQAVEAGQG